MLHRNFHASLKKRHTLLLASLPGTLLAQGTQSGGANSNSLLVGVILLLMMALEWFILYKRAKRKAAKQ